MMVSYDDDDDDDDADDDDDDDDDDRSAVGAADCRASNVRLSDFDFWIYREH